MEWENVSESVYSQQKNLIFGNKENRPDAIYHAGMGASEIIKYAKRKVLVPISDYLDYMPNFKKLLEERPDIKAQLLNVEDGKIYSLPRIEEMGLLQNPNLLFLNVAWTKEAITVQAGARFNYTDVFTAFESFLLKGKFTYTGKGCFGLAFDYNGQAGKYKLITLDPTAQKLQLQFNEGSTLITEAGVQLEAGKEYAFTYIQEGSVGIFYLDDASLTVRLYGVSGKPIRLYVENNVVNFTDLREYTK